MSNEPTFAEEMLAESQMMRLLGEELISKLDKTPETDPGAITSLATRIADCRRKMDARRVELKSPHDDKANAVQAAFAPWIKDLDEAKKRASAMMAGREVRTALGLATTAPSKEVVVTDAMKFCEWLALHAPEAFMDWLTQMAGKLQRNGLSPDGVRVNETRKTKFVR